MALSLLVGMFTGAVAGAFVTTASATTPAACTASPASTTTCAVTLAMTSGTWTVRGGTPPTTFPTTATAGLKAQEKPATGTISAGTLAIPPTPESNTGSTETILFDQITPGSATGSINAKGQVTITDQLAISVAITKPIIATCVSTPVTVTLRSTTAYDPTTGDVTLSDMTFSIPDFKTTGCGEATGPLNNEFAGTTGNALTLDLSGTLLVPPTPTKSTTTALSVTSPVPAATGGTVVGQTTTLTATVRPGGPHGVTGYVQFVNTTVDLGAPVSLTSGATPATATLTTTTLPVGANHLKAVYSGDGTYLTSTSAVVSYTVAASPTVHLNFPSSVTVGAAPTQFTGAIANPVNGPGLSHARLTFALSGVTSLKGTTITLEVCTTASYPTSTATKCTKVILTGTTSITGHYGGPLAATSFALAPGQQIPLWFELSFASGADYGRLVVVASVVAVTGTTVTTLAKQPAATVTVLGASGRIAPTFKMTSEESSTKTRQNYVAIFAATLKAPVVKPPAKQEGPTPSGSITFYRAPTTTPNAKTPIGSVLHGVLHSSTIEVNVTWPVGTYDITATYSGDPFYLTATTTSLLVFTIETPIAGTAYTCTKTTALGTTTYPAGSLVVTAASAPTLPPTAVAGSTLTVSHLAVNFNVDPGYFGPPGYISNLSVGFTPGGTAVGALPTGLAAGSYPVAVGVNPTTDKIYVANTGGHAGTYSKVVSVVTGTTNTVVAAVPVGTGPSGVAVNPAVGPTGTIYVTNSRSDTVSVIDGQTGTVTATIPVGKSPSGVAVNPAVGPTGTIYVANSKSNTVSVIDGQTDTVVATVPVGTDPTAVAVNPKTNTIYVANQVTPSAVVTGTVSVITGAANPPAVIGAPVTVGNRPRGVAVNPKTNTIYVTNYGSKSVSVMAGTTNTVTKTVTVGSNPVGVAVDPTAGSTGKIYVANSTSYDVSVITGAMNTVTATTSLGAKAYPERIAVNPSTSTIYTATMGYNTVSVIAGSTDTLTTTVTSGAGTLTKTATTILTDYGSFTAAGTVTLSGTPGQVTVGLGSFSWTKGYSALTEGVITCTPVTTPAVLGTLTAIPPVAPAVTTQPASQTVDVGAAATFSAVASGQPAPTVQWQSSANGTTWTDIAGATQATQTTGSTATSYTTGPVATADNATQYRAVFTNATGTVASSPATLTVDTAPAVTTQPSNEAVTAGTPVTFTAAATARPAASAQWQVSTDGGTTFTNVAGATSTSLTFAPTTATSGNRYRAVFTNTLGKATTTAATLTVTTAAYRLVGADGAVYDFGSASYEGSMGGQPLDKPIVGTADTPTGNGYWEVASDGGIFSFGTAQFFGSMGGQALNKPIVGMAATPTGGGYWLVASDGGIFAFGNAQFYGSMGGQPLNKPIVGMAATPTGGGYWLVASDGGIFAFGNAQFYGSTGSLTLDKPIVGMAATPTGGGYWLVASDGGIFSFGDAPFYGSAAGGSAGPIVAMTATPTGNGYWLAGSNGSVTAFGDAPLAGSMAGQALNAPIVAMTG